MGLVYCRLGIFFFVNSEILVIRIWRKKRVKYHKFEIARKQRNSNISPTCNLFLPFARCYMILPCYLHSIYKFCFIYKLWKWNLWSFSNFHVQGSKFGGKFHKFGGKKLFKNRTPRSSWGSFFPSLVHCYLSDYIACIMV